MMQSRLESIIKPLPQPLRFAFAYGSGVFSQKEAGPEHSSKPSTKDGKKMIDLVIAVTHPEHWHGINMSQNKKHYSLMARMLGSIGVGYIQKIGAGLWYNPYVKIGDEIVKYGVMDINTLCQDLLDWDTLYISGRMHKPVALIETDARVRLAQQVNLTSALRTSLLLLPEQFTEVELYTRIASISYTGDFRMSVPGGENADKVRNIVLGQRDMFRRLYAGLIRSLETIHVEETRHNRFHMIVSDSYRRRR
jgi:translocator assembly and maintenance protein 41